MVGVWQAPLDVCVYLEESQMQVNKAKCGPASGLPPNLWHLSCDVRRAAL